jgi:hypothetical protein
MDVITICLCDFDGNLLEILCDDLHILGGVGVKHSAVHIFKKSSIGQFLDFLLIIRKEGISPSTRLSVIRGGESICLNFVGVAFSSSILLSAADCTQDIYADTYKSNGTPKDGYLEILTNDDTMRINNDLINMQRELSKKNTELRSALSEIKTLRGFIPICASCKKIRDDKGYWEQIEKYLQKKIDAQFTHSICPGCMKKLYSESD